MFNDRLSINAIVCHFVLLMLHSVYTDVQSAKDSTLVLLNAHAYILNALSKGYSI